MPDTEVRPQVLGVLWLVVAAVSFLKAAWIAVEFNVLTVMWGALLNRVPNPYPWMSYFHFLLVGVIVVDIAAGIFGFLGGLAWLTGGRSARFFLTVASVLSLITGPLGLMLGVYTLAVALARVRRESAIHTLSHAA